MNIQEKREYYKSQRLGLRKQNLDGSWMEIIEYNNGMDLTVRFDTGYISEHKAYKEFRQGKIRDYLYPSSFGGGYIGIGTYETGKQHRKIYNTWSAMLHRCYEATADHKDFKYYIDCTVCEEWHNYQQFAEWFDSNYYEVPNRRMCLDKDIIKKKNKIYAPEYCCIVPDNINLLFSKLNTHKAKALPIGVGRDTKTGAYTSSVRMESQSRYLGYYHTPEEAFYAYKAAKEAHIKQMADKYKQWLPDKVYQAMYAYEIDIND